MTIAGGKKGKIHLDEIVCSICKSCICFQVSNQQQHLIRSLTGGGIYIIGDSFLLSGLSDGARASVCSVSLWLIFS